jgi:hypothetical protein
MPLIKLNRQALFLTMLALITVILWIAINIYLAATQSTVSKITAEQIAPFDPTLKTEVITSLKNRL